MEAGLIIAQLLLQYGPGLAASVAAILHAPADPTLAAWNAVFAQARSYSQIIAGPAVAVPANATATPASPVV